ncbi:MAG: chemotaxis protein CheW [Gammaproteobacteria bacterium]
MENAAEIFCTLLPLEGERLLLPRACVAEVAAWNVPVPVSGAPAWLLGRLAWNGTTVPVVSFEALQGHEVPPATGRTRVALLRTLGPRLAGQWIGVVTQGFPQGLRVTRDALKTAGSDLPPGRGPVLCRVLMVNESPLVPDLEALEALVADELAAP